MISASLPTEGLAQLSHLYAGAAGAAPEFLPPPPRPHARYAPRAPPHHDHDAYSRYLHAFATYRAPAYPPAATAAAEAAAAAAATRRAGFVPPAPAPAPPPHSPRARAPRRRAAEHFRRGALIRLASGALRRVEDMRTEDFVASAESCADLRLTHCTVLRLEPALTLAYDNNRSRVEMETAVEHPFFVYGQGWASCSPELTLQCYGLQVRRLQVGDVCVSLVAREQPREPPRAPPTPQVYPENLSVKEDTRKRRWSAPDVCEDELVQSQLPVKKR